MNLDLRDTNITNVGLAQLRTMTQLKRLYLAGTYVNDEGLDHLFGLKQLVDLDLGGPHVTPNGVARLQAALPGCRIQADYYGPEEKQPPAVEWPADFRPTRAALIARIKELRGQCGADGNDAGTPIQKLRLKEVRIGDRSLLRLLDELPELEILQLIDIPVGNDFVRGLVRCPRLRELTLDNSFVTDRGIGDIARLPSIRRLGFVGTRLTDTGLLRLSTMSALEYLDVSVTHVTDAGIATLQGSLPNCRVNTKEHDELNERELPRN